MPSPPPWSGSLEKGWAGKMFSYLKRGKKFYQEIFLLALPIILQNLVTASLGLIDTFMVGTLGEGPLASVTQANIPVFIIQLVIFGLQSGSSVLISQFWGKGDRASINRVMGIGFYAAGAISLLFAVVMVAFPTQLMALLTNNAALIPDAAAYARIVGPSYVFNALTGVYIGAHRSMENPKLGLIVFSTSMVTNTFLNWVLIFGNLGAPSLGVVGAAAATFASRVVEFLVMVVYAAGSRRFRLHFPTLLRPGRALVEKFIHYSSPVILNETLWGLGTSMYKVIMGHMEHSESILAARAIAGNIEDLCSVAIFAVSGTAAIVVGREIGAGRKDTVYEVGATMDTLAFLLGGTVGVALIIVSHLLFPSTIYPLFHLSAGSAQIATMMLTFSGGLLALRAFDSCNTVGVLRGGGDVRAAMLIDTMPMWLVAIPAAAVTGLVFKQSIFWVCACLGLESLVKFSFGVRRFRSRAWINDITQI